MSHYLVEWRIDVQASGHHEAAEKARRIQLDKGSLATCFDVLEVTENGLEKVVVIDLDR